MTTTSPSVVGVLAWRLARNPVVYAKATLEALRVPTVEGTRVDNVLWLAVVIVAGLAGWLAMFRWWPSAGALLLCYGLLLLIWPYPVRRFLVPVLPLIAIAVLAGAQEIGRLAGRSDSWRRSALAPALLALLIGIGVVPDAARAVRQAATCDRARPYESAGCYDANERAFFAATAFAADSIPRGARFFTAKEGIFFLRTGHPTLLIGPGAGLSGSDLHAHLRSAGASHILLTHLKNDEYGLVRPLLEICRDLTLVRRWEPAAVLLALPAPGDSAGGGACEAIEAYSVAPWGDRAR